MCSMTYQTTERGFRINPNWQQLQTGDPVVSDYIINQGRFVPFLIKPGYDPDYTKVSGEVLARDLCFPYGELTDRKYADLRR